MGEGLPANRRHYILCCSVGGVPLTAAVLWYIYISFFGVVALSHLVSIHKTAFCVGAKGKAPSVSINLNARFVAFLWQNA